MITRFEDWPSRLFGLIESRRHAPFAWAKNDCCLFACDAVLAMTGVDPAAPFRGYESKEEAEALIAEYGTLEDLVADRCREMNFAEQPPAMAQRGDLALFDNDGNPALGICVGAEVAFPGRTGIALIPVGCCRRSWRVG